MKNRIILFVLLFILASLSLVIGFVLGFRHGTTASSEVFLSYIDNSRYSMCVSDAAAHHRILRELRHHDLENAQRIAETHIDQRLIEASTITNRNGEAGTAYLTTDWVELRDDRARYPRRNTNATSEIRINHALDELIEEQQPQPAGGAYVAPEAGAPSAHP